jgi:hypothetical protein
MSDSIASNRELINNYESWWHHEGSGMTPLPGEDQKEHVHRIARIAWLNGACVQKYRYPVKTSLRIEEEMEKMPARWRNRWCNSQTCACMGCANISGGLREKGFAKEDWLQWKNQQSLES